ncbi:SulP family inorganic anion transporter [Puniceicoccales bacterium CK1056]|uniref:SulP family inorganic anion transporter n=1 Tax=Oceanipulchritudo coccoides TaxID=2706888 RepID=A0A6B2M134_9BACT|nr:SulP family inorganic anion transporter [Oceanipulchritudo coccoides]NDV61430.1 SulP family inorganic anion transporter [Oceanipulchritudo coccoides]
MFDIFRKTSGSYKDDILSGLTVALALVPEAIAFSFAAGVDPLVGLWAAVFMGFITSAAGGRPGMISGATGAIAVVAGKAVQHGDALGDGLGLQYLFAVIMLAGLIQILLGVLKLGRFIRLVPHPVMIGFVNGLAIVILMAQFPSFQNMETGEWLSGAPLMIMAGLVILTMLIIQFLPILTKAVPSSLAAIVVVGLIAFFFFKDTATVSNVLAQSPGNPNGILSGSFPLPSLPTGIAWGTEWSFILKTAFIVAMVGVIESLMTLQLIDEITETRGHGNRECIAQGGANFLSGLFGGMGGCAMIGQSLINMKSGGRGRASGLTAALALAFFIMAGGPVIQQIPIAALVGVMFMVVIGTFEWSSLKTFGKVPFSEIIVIVAVTLVTVTLHDLATAVFVGIILSALIFAWESSKHVFVTIEKETPEEKIYALQGLLYFGSVREFMDRFQASSDVKNIVIDFGHARVCDMSGLEAINALGERYRKSGKTLHIRHLSADCRRMLEKAGSMVDVEVLPDDPDYTVARLRGMRSTPEDVTVPDEMH